MLPYWFLFALIAFGAALDGPGRHQSGRARTDPALFFAAVLIAVMIGVRYHVGGDWWTYQRYYNFAALASFGQMFGLDDVGYQLLNWVVAHLGAGIWLTNLVCGIVFAWGLVALARTQPYPWLSVLIAVPYLIIVVAMGYSRQGVAIGILMAGIASLTRNRSILRYTLYVAAAALFHRTAVVGLPLLLLGGRRNLLGNALIVVGGSVLLFDVLLASSVDHFVTAYVTQQMTSQGAAVRVTMSLVPAVLFLVYRRRLGFTPDEEHIWRNLSYAALALLVALFATSASTVVDRLALYILPLQLAVLPRIAGPIVSVRLGKGLIIAYCLAIQFVWLNYAENSLYWIPYRVYPFGEANPD